MNFKKNDFSASVCKVGAILLGLFSTGIAVLMLISKNLERDLFPYLIMFWAAIIIAEFTLALCIVEYTSTVTVSKEGITLNSKLRGIVHLDWEQCGTIGIFGYNWGLNGVLLFSRERHIFTSQDDCRKFANKNHKTIISVQYTPEIFAEIEKFAPPHLVNRVKILMR